MYVCLCRGLKEEDVRRAARDGSTTGDELIAALDLRNPLCCGRCVRGIERLVLIARQPADEPVARPTFTPVAVPVA